MFYFIAEMWGSVVISILFWGMANQICSVKAPPVPILNLPQPVPLLEYL